jgi:hypothetical protein
VGGALLWYGAKLLQPMGLARIDLFPAEDWPYN